MNEIHAYQQTNTSFSERFSYSLQGVEYNMKECWNRGIEVTERKPGCCPVSLDLARRKPLTELVDGDWVVFVSIFSLECCVDQSVKQGFSKV